MVSWPRRATFWEMDLARLVRLFWGESVSCLSAAAEEDVEAVEAVDTVEATEAVDWMEDEEEPEVQEVEETSTGGAPEEDDEAEEVKEEADVRGAWAEDAESCAPAEEEA